MVIGSQTDELLQVEHRSHLLSELCNYLCLLERSPFFLLANWINLPHYLANHRRAANVDGVAHQCATADSWIALFSCRGVTEGRSELSTVKVESLMARMLPWLIAYLLITLQLLTVFSVLHPRFSMRCHPRLLVTFLPFTMNTETSNLPICRCYRCSLLHIQPC